MGFWFYWWGFGFTTVLDTHEVMDNAYSTFILLHLDLSILSQVEFITVYNLKHRVDIMLPYLTSKPKQNKNVWPHYN